jgi:hypothetical protein
MRVALHLGGVGRSGGEGAPGSVGLLAASARPERVPGHPLFWTHVLPGPDEALGPLMVLGLSATVILLVARQDSLDSNAALAVLILVLALGLYSQSIRGTLMKVPRAVTHRRWWKIPGSVRPQVALLPPPTRPILNGTLPSMSMLVQWTALR